MHVFYFHEDDAGQEQLLPIEWWDHCRSELAAIAEHAEAHQDPHGAGLSAIYTFKEAGPELPRLDMTEARFHALLEPHCRRFERLDSPLAAIDAELGIRGVGYGPPGSGAGIIANLAEDKVGLLWGRFFTQDTAAGKTLANMLAALCTDQHLLLVDWAGHRLVDLRDRAKLESYLRGD